MHSLNTSLESEINNNTMSRFAGIQTALQALTPFGLRK
jgi:hypothetical protein